MNNFTTDEREVIDAQGWNADSLVTLLSAYDPTTGVKDRLTYLRRAAAAENGIDVPELAPPVTSDQMAALYRIECRFADDDAKTDLEVICTDCGEHLCDVEHGDTVGVLVSVAQDHARECVPNDDDGDDDDE